MYKLTTAYGGTVICPDNAAGILPADVDAFIDRMEDLEVQARRARRTAAPRRRAPRASAPDRPPEREKIELVLYTSSASEKSRKALRAVNAVLAEYERSQIKFTVCDLATATTAEADGIIFTPTLVKKAPGPRTWIIGNLEHRDLLIDLLDVSGVQRRKS